VFHAKIGELTLENDFLAGALTWVRGPRAHAAGSAPGKAAVFLGFCSGHR
jgi:hypothetical protein